MNPKMADLSKPGLPAWMLAMRQAAQDAINEEDVRAIVAKQVEKAKEGDPAAMRFVFDYLLGGSAFKGATIVQNNYGADPREPTPHRPGTNGKITAMQARLSQGLPLTRGDDCPVDLG